MEEFSDSMLESNEDVLNNQLLNRLVCDDVLKSPLLSRLVVCEDVIKGICKIETSIYQTSVHTYFICVNNYLCY